MAETKDKTEPREVMYLDSNVSGSVKVRGYDIALDVLMQA